MTNDQIWDMTIIHNNPNRPFLASAFALIASILPIAAAPTAPQNAGAAVIVSHDDVRINYLGAWDTTGGGTAAKQDAHETATNGDFYEFTFLGTGIEIVHRRQRKRPRFISIWMANRPRKRNRRSGPGSRCRDLPVRRTALSTAHGQGRESVGRADGAAPTPGFGVQAYHEAPGNTFADRSKLLKASATYQYKNDFKLGLLYAIACFDAGKDKEGLELAADFARHRREQECELGLFLLAGGTYLFPLL